jgi:predicted metal-dependent hydrolase
MTDQQHEISDPNGKEIAVFVRRDKRLKKSWRWIPQRDGSILVRVPSRLPKRQIGKLLDQVAEDLKKQETLAERRTDTDLQRRTEYINRKYFGGEIQWRAIRWVNNMERRLGSCTTGGATDGHIRISANIKDWPQWVIDYVIAHELVHRLHPNHSKAFWSTLIKGYPRAERARGFIQGMNFASGLPDEDDV